MRDRVKNRKTRDEALILVCTLLTKLSCKTASWPEFSFYFCGAQAPLTGR
jgi:hypothetical protein